MTPLFVQAQRSGRGGILESVVVTLRLAMFLHDWQRLELF
jgi:hypothetical protein